jgi:hypothetical protein
VVTAFSLEQAGFAIQGLRFGRGTVIRGSALGVADGTAEPQSFSVNAMARIPNPACNVTVPTVSEMLHLALSRQRGQQPCDGLCQTPLGDRRG